MTEDFYDRLDDYDDGREPCSNCGKLMSSESDGDGIMTMSYDYCEDCGNRDEGEPVRITNELIAWAKNQGLIPN